MDEPAGAAARVAALQSMLMRLSRALEGTLREEAGALDLTPAQAEVLRFAARVRPDMATVGQLARLLGVRHPTAVGILRPLVGRGLLERRPHPYDARQHSLALTAAGDRVLGGLDAIESSFGLALRSLEPRQLQGLDEGLVALMDSLAASDLLVVAAPCRGCAYFEEDRTLADGASRHHCRLIERHLTEAESRMDCPEHTPVEHQRAAGTGGQT